MPRENIRRVPLQGEHLRRTGDSGVSEGYKAPEVTQRAHLLAQRIVVSEPSTLAPLLNSFQMGFRRLAIQKRSSLVWELLGIVKTEFGKYADVLAKVKRKLNEAQNTIDKAETRSRAIQSNDSPLVSIAAHGGQGSREFCRDTIVPRTHSRGQRQALPLEHSR